MICLIVPLYLVGAVIFWSSHKSESLKLDFLTGLAWPVIAPVEVAMFVSRRVRAALEERRVGREKARADREAELRGREEHFIGYGGEGIAQWMAEDVAEGKGDKDADKLYSETNHF